MRKEKVKDTKNLGVNAVVVCCDRLWLCEWEEFIYNIHRVQCDFAVTCWLVAEEERQKSKEVHLITYTLC